MLWFVVRLILKTSSVTLDLFYVFDIILSFSTCSQSLWEILSPNVLLNPALTPAPPVTARDEPWPFFLFWRHHFWPKLNASILNFCRRKRSFQWCPDQSDQPNGALYIDMQKNAQKVEWKTQRKFSCHYTWLLHAKNCPSWWRFLRSFF